MNNPIEWQAPEYTHYEKNQNWFWTAGIIVAILILSSLIFKNFLFAIIVLLGAFTAMMYGARPPEMITFALTPKGLRIKDRLYLYHDLKSFWVSDEYHHRKIIVESSRLILPHIIVPLPEKVTDAEARDFLLQYLAEERHEESLIDLIADYFGY